jgi:hypothetical protein
MCAASVESMTGGVGLAAMPKTPACHSPFFILHFGHHSGHHPSMNSGHHLGNYSNMHSGHSRGGIIPFCIPVIAGVIISFIIPDCIPVIMPFP